MISLQKSCYMLFYRDLGDKKFVEEFYNEGKIMISNLYRFKILENQLRKDCTEGFKKFSALINPEEKVYPLYIEGSPHYNEKKELVKDLSLYRKIEMANCFAMSFSLNPSPKESSIVIKDIHKFEKLISDELHAKYILGEIIKGDCLYFESNEEDETHIDKLEIDYFQLIYKNPQLCFFLKNKTFYEENEFRIVWLPFYNEKASIKIHDQIRHYGYKENVNLFYYPNYLTEFPNEDEMIPIEPLFISNKDLISCAL